MTSSTIGSSSSTGGPGSISPISAAPLLEAAEKALASGDARLAETLARRGAEAEPRNAQAQRLLGEATLSLGEDNDAEKAFTAAVALDSNNAAAQFGLARVAERQKKWSTAASHYRRALDLDPRNTGGIGVSAAMENWAHDRSAWLKGGGSNGSRQRGRPKRLGFFLFRAGETNRAVESSSRPCG